MSPLNVALLIAVAVLVGIVILQHQDIRFLTWQLRQLVERPEPDDDGEGEPMPLTIAADDDEAMRCGVKPYAPYQTPEGVLHIRRAA